MADFWITLSVSGSEDDARQISEAIARVAVSQNRPGVQVTGPTMGENWLSLNDDEVKALDVRANNKTIISPPRGW